MASTKEYLDFIMGQLSNLEEITYRAMMKEYILYYRGKMRHHQQVWVDINQIV